jgi:hypothetical protein
MARGMANIKGGTTKVPPPSSGMWNDFVLGSRPAALRAPPLGRPSIKPNAASTRVYGKQPDPFSTLGQGNTGQSGMT